LNKKPGDAKNPGDGKKARDVTPTLREERERSLEATLRPQRLSDDEYINQDTVKGQLRILIDAAKGRGEPLDHVALHGPPGVGKTSLAGVIANELGVPIRITSGPAIERAGDLAAILTSLQVGEVLFIDEVHRLPRLVEEILYPAMDVFQLDIVIGKGPGARTLRLPLPRFTLVGATTRIGRLSSPLRDRFGATYRLYFFETEALEKVVRRSARILGVEIEAAAAHEIARRSRGTPRIANRWLKRVRDFAQVRHDGRVTLAVAREALVALEVDDKGLDRADRMLLGAIIDKFSGGPVGLETLAAALSEDSETIEDMYEPYLMQEGYLKRTPRGRVVTEHAYRHLGRTPPTGATLWNGAQSDEVSRTEE
jgi:holliday junction DNA helicase RuvB